VVVVVVGDILVVFLSVVVGGEVEGRKKDGTGVEVFKIKFRTPLDLVVCPNLVWNENWGCRFSFMRLESNSVKSFFLIDFVGCV
jgi:hypothetical protein